MKEYTSRVVGAQKVDKRRPKERGGLNKLDIFQKWGRELVKVGEEEEHHQ